MNRFFRIFLFILAAVLACGFSFAQEDNFSLIVESRYFSVYSYRGLDVYSLLDKLNFDYLVHLNSLSRQDPADAIHILAKTLDALYLEVSDILDIHVYSFHGNITIVPDRDSVDSIFKRYAGRKLGERSFYLHDNSTIYISFEDLTLGMLGHEMSHAIISHFFIVPPPAKTQEVLCGYVEYSLRKATGTLPK